MNNALLAGDARFISKYPNVVFEESDHEVVVVNLLTGVYYFLTGSAAFVWLALHAGKTIDAVVGELTSDSNDSTVVTDDLNLFVVKLLELELLTSYDGKRPFDQETPRAPDYMRDGYAPPALESFADLQDILLLDPVHDVDESGWPSFKD